MQYLVPLLKPEYATMVRRMDLEGTPLQALKKQLEASCGTCTEHGCLDCMCSD